MVLNTSIRILNYKCFRDKAEGFEKIYPINLIIGKNNSGKSTLLDIIQYIVAPRGAYNRLGLEPQTEILISDFITGKQIRQQFPTNKSGGVIPGYSHFEYGSQFINKRLTYLLTDQPKKVLKEVEKEFIPEIRVEFERIADLMEIPLYGKSLRKISAERDVIPEVEDNKSYSVSPAGVGLTNVLRRVTNEANFNGHSIKQNLLINLNLITKPDIEFTDLQILKNTNQQWEIYFHDSMKGRIPLSKMGSGIKTIILTLYLLLISPEVDDFDIKNAVLCFEELENNLHPALQRRLFHYLSDFSERNNAYFFITTHSNTVIDLFFNKQNAQILHVESNGKTSSVSSISSYSQGKALIKDMEFKASDLLLSNGVIWVEGPSDVIYLELFFDLFKLHIDDKGESKLNYTIQSLSTSIWKYAGFDEFDWLKIDETLENKIISLTKINHNHLIVLDKDNNYENKKPSEWKDFSDGTGKNKARLIFEAIRFADKDENDLENNYGDASNNLLMFWINNGTFETYLEHFVLTKGKDFFGKYFDQKKSRGYFEKKFIGPNHSISKVDLATQVAKFASDSRLSFLDFAPEKSELYNKVERLFNTIKTWN